MVTKLMIDKFLFPSVQSQFQKLLPYLALCLIVWGYYFFFCEHLPWFWYDDISVLERAEATSLLDNLKGILNFAPQHYYIDSRPVLIIFSKICLAFFGEVPGYHRALKLVAFVSLLVMLLYLLSKNGVEKKFSVVLLLLFTTLPPVFIVNSWIYEAETFELLLKVVSFGIFWSCLDKDRQSFTEKFARCAFLVLIVILADKTKAPAKIIPVLFLSFLALTRSKDKVLYAASVISLAAVFPYGMVSGGAGTLASGSAAGLLKTFVTQMWGVLAVASLSVLLARKSIFKSRLFVFSLLWLGCELLFYKAYPSTEMRYLYSSMASACFLAAISLFHGATAIQVMIYRNIFATAMLIIICLFSLRNTYWIYNFRASFCSAFIIADKQIQFVNENYANSLFLYNNDTQFYYQRKSSNKYLSVPLYEKSTRMSFANEVYKPYEHVLSDIESASMLMTDNKLSLNLLSEFSSGTNSVFDKFQSVVNVSTKGANLYDNSLRMLTRYPDLKSIYIMRQL